MGMEESVSSAGSGQPGRQLGRSVWALVAGFLAVVAITLATDLMLHMSGFFPPMGQPVSDAPLAVATLYRSIYAIFGSYLTARLAPRKPMAHALIGGFIGLIISTVGAVVTWNGGPAYGPHWYPLALIATALPCAWAGGTLFLMQRRQTVAQQ